MDLMDVDNLVDEKSLKLINFIDAMIKLLEDVKIDAKKETETGYFTLYRIGDKLECYGLNIERQEERAERRWIKAQKITHNIFH